jgi:hypothetical protein
MNNARFYLHRPKSTADLRRIKPVKRLEGKLELWASGVDSREAAFYLARLRHCPVV